MSAVITKVDSTTVEDDERIVKVVVFGDKDVRTANEYLPYGIDSNPIKGMLAAYFTSTVSGEDLITGYANENRQASPGELRIYATNASGVEQNYIYLTRDGEIHIGGTADNMVRYSELETAYDQLKSDHDDVVTDNNNLKTALSAFQAALTSAGGTPLTGTSLAGIVATTLATYYGQPLSPSTGDITPAKIDEIKTS